jgi:small redox-active disulfide protein 2
MAAQTAQELGIEFELEKVSEIDEITAFGVMSTPALVVNGDVKVSGRLPSAEELKEMIA